MSTYRGAIATVAVLMHLAAPAQQDKGDGTLGAAGDEVDDTCKEADFFAAAGKAMTAKLAEAHTKITQIRTEQQRYELAALAATTNEAPGKYAALAAYLQQRASKAIDLSKQASDAVQGFSAKANRWAGAQAGAATAASATYNLATAPAGEGNGRTYSIPLTGSAKGNNACHNDDIKTTTAGGKDLQLTTLKKLQISSEALIQAPIQTYTIALQGCNDNGGTANCGSTANIFGANAAGGQYIVLGNAANGKSAKVTGVQSTPATYSTTQPTSVYKNDDKTNGCATPGDASDKLIPTAASLASSLCIALQKVAEITKIKANPTGSDLAADDDFLNSAVSDIPSLQRYIQLSKEGTKNTVQEAIKQIYGANDAAMNTKTVEPANRLHLYYNNNGKKEKTTVADALNTDMAPKSLTFMWSLKVLIQKTPKQETSTRKEENECSEKKGTDCKGECEWDKEKETCKPKEKGEGENKDKTGATNTTGSNSFIINKTPLLLAFLLLP
uniref:Variant surface glycoprotein 488 n=1 Tax=Trypanosoma brucei TaxID=5691 RepID=M4T061_9TRYP|nr:variant surface glycoprotein 488 [Trypanosoma brucei]